MKDDFGMLSLANGMVMRFYCVVVTKGTIEKLSRELNETMEAAARK